MSWRKGLELVHPSWLPIIGPLAPRIAEIWHVIDERGEAELVTPPHSLVFRALTMPLPDVRVVIVGQDPYPGQGVATGLAFEVALGRAYPPTLRNIAAEYQSDVGREFDVGVMQAWAGQGVLLLNRILTTRVGTSLAHQKIGWQAITDALLAAIVEARPNVVGVLWGTKAQAVAHRFNPAFLVCSAHPSPLSAHRGFFGSAPFTRVNTLLETQGVKPILW